MLGIVRLLWPARADANANVAELDAIRAIGESLSLALDPAKSGKGTMGESAALQRADEALRHLGMYVAAENTSALLTAAEGRLRVARRSR